MVLPESSGVAPNSDVPSLRTSTFKRCVKRLAMGGTGTLITTAVSIARVPLHQFLPVSLNLFLSIRLLIDIVSVVPLQFPWAEPKASAKLETALTTPRLEDISRIRARNALKIMLDVQGDISS